MVVHKLYREKAVLCYICLSLGIFSMVLVSTKFPCNPYERVSWDPTAGQLKFPPNFDSSKCYRSCVEYEAYFSLYVARHSKNLTEFNYALSFIPEDGQVYTMFYENVKNRTYTKFEEYQKLAKEMEGPLEKTPNPFCIIKFLSRNRLSVPPEYRPNVTNDEFQEIQKRSTVGRYGHYGHVLIYSIGLFGVFLFLCAWFMYRTYIPKKLVMVLFFAVSGLLFAGWMCGVTGALDKLNCHFYGGNKGLEWNITGTKYRSYCGGSYNVRNFTTGKKTEETYETPGHPFLIWWYYYISAVLDFIGIVCFALAPGLK